MSVFKRYTLPCKIMKNITLNIALFSLLVAYASCNKITETIEQDIIVHDTVDFQIPILSSTSNSTIVSGIPLTLNLEEEVKSGLNKFSVNQIKSTKLKSLHMGLGLIGKDSIDTKNNFSNLESIKFRITAAGSLANLANSANPLGGSSGAIALNPVIVPDSLKTFLLNPAKTYEVTFKAKKVTTTPLSFRVASTYIITLAK